MSLLGVYHMGMPHTVHTVRADMLASQAQEATAKIDEYARGMISGSGSTLFEELGLYYIGPVDGHNLDTVISILQGAACLSCRYVLCLLEHEEHRMLAQKA